MATVGGGVLGLQALEAVRLVAPEFGLDASDLKPCVAYLLDGNLGGAGRHDAAFVLGLELRRMGLNEHEMEQPVRQWARGLDYGEREAVRNARDAYKKRGDGTYRYFPPGLKKGPRATSVLGAICTDVGCPEQCPPLATLRRGSKQESFQRFDQLGWPAVLKRARLRSAVDVYWALCELELVRGFSCGNRLYVSYEQLEEKADVSKSTVRRSLMKLGEYGLVAFTPGLGRSGPRNRWASEVSRVVPIPSPAHPDGADCRVGLSRSGVE